MNAVHWPAVSAIASALAIGREVQTASPQTNIYSATGRYALAPAAARARPLVYVPNSRSATVTVIDPGTYRVVRSFSTGTLPQHVVPSYDLGTLWVASNEGNSLTPIDPVTGEDGTRVPVDDPYNLYFTPDGRFAMVIAERLDRIDFRDARDMTLVQSLPVACKGVDHMEFTADGRYAIATCEFSGQLVKIDVGARAVVGYLNLVAVSSPLKKLTGLLGRRHGDHASAPMPQDIRSSADGTLFYVADMKDGGVFLVDPIAFVRVGFIKTGVGRMDSIRAVMAPACTSRTGAGVRRQAVVTARDRSACSSSLHDGSSSAGPFPAAAVPTWETSPPTAANSGSQDDMTTRSTFLPPSRAP
jgi:YVTN family beta-propeller protein